jgi:branched-chain amino acid transport system ATP-binding protein
VTVSEVVLKIENLQVRYGPVEALRGLDFEVRTGEIVTLIGANGAGKTTTLRALSGLLQDVSGSICFEGEELLGKIPSDIVQQGLIHVPEARRLFPRMSVEENLTLGGYRLGPGVDLQEDLERVFALFPRLKERRTQLAGTLSGGEQQMVAMGRGLMARPEVLLLDEPSMGLAPLLVQDVFQAIREIHEAGIPVLLVEQNANQALHIASRAYVLETGKILFQGTGKELLQDPRVRSAYLGE